MFDRDLVHAKRRRLHKAADVRSSATRDAEGPVAPPEGETTGPAADEAARLMEVMPLTEATALPPPVEIRMEEEEVVRAPSSPRHAAPLEPQEIPVTETAGTSTLAPGGADIEMEEQVLRRPLQALGLRGRRLRLRQQQARLQQDQQRLGHLRQPSKPARRRCSRVAIPKAERAYFRAPVPELILAQAPWSSSLRLERAQGPWF